MSNTNTPATQQKSKLDVLKDIMAASSVQEQFKNALQENSGVFVASVIDLFNSDTYLQNCEPKQVVMECLKAATLKLPINKNLGFAYVVPYKKGEKQIPQFQIGYKGYIQLAMRTGQYRIINADKVFDGEYRTKNKLTGEFDLSGTAKSQTVVGFFAHIEMLNGFAKTLYMTKEQVTEHARKYSKSYNNYSSAWQTDFDAMALKTVLRNLLSHYGYLSVEMMGAMNVDIEADGVGSEVNENIRTYANREEMTFDDAEVVNENKDGNPI